MFGMGPGFGTVISLGFIYSLYKGWLPYSNDVNVLAKVLFVVVNCIIFATTFAESSFNLFHRATGLKAAWMPKYVSRLGFFDKVNIILLILLKYPLKGLWLVSSYKVSEDGKSILVPELRLDSSIKIDQSDEARYDKATKSTVAPAKSTGIKKSTASGAQAESRLLLLPALTTPLMLVLMANRNNPVLPFGSVNTANRFEFLNPEACRDPVQTLELGTRATVTARMGGDKLPGRRVKRGVELDVVIEFKAPLKGETQSKVVFRQIITILAFLPKTAKPAYNEAAAVDTDQGAQLNWAKEPNAAVSLDSGSPGNWAAVCSDYNPIHMSTLLAKMFGFKARIAHGNHVVASALEAMQAGKQTGVAERGLKTLFASKQPSFLQVQFKRPMVLPTDLVVRFGSSKDLKTYAFDVERSDKEYVSGRAGELHD